MFDKWKMLRLLLEKLSRDVTVAAENTDDDRKGLQMDQSARDYHHVLKKMEMLDEMASVYDEEAMLTTSSPKPENNAIPKRTYSVTGRPVDTAPVGVYRVIWANGHPDDFCVIGLNRCGDKWMACTRWPSSKLIRQARDLSSDKSDLFWTDIHALYPIEA